MGIPPVLKPLLPGEPRIYNPPFEQRLTEQHLLPHLTALEACFLELRTQLDPELEQALPVKLGKPYPLGQCLEISAAVFERLRSVQEHQLEPCAASGLRAIRRFQHAGGAFRAVWGDLRGRFFQNAFLLGTLYVDVSNDTVVPTKPKVEILPFHQAEFHPVRDFAHFADLARLYWGDTIYVNHVLPELAPYCPLIHVSATGAIKLHDTSQYMLSLTLRGGFEPSEHMLRAPAMPEALRQHIQRALADTPFTCAGSADAGRRQALLLCKQYRSKRRHQRRAITDALVNTVRNVNQHLAKTPYPVANNGADSAVVTAASGPHNTEPGGSAGIAHYTQTDLPAPLRLCVTTDPVPAETTDSPLNPARIRFLLLNAGIITPDNAAVCVMQRGNFPDAPAQLNVCMSESIRSVSDLQQPLPLEAFGSWTAQPAFDTLGLVGVWDHCSEQERSALVRMMGQTLKTGGVLYVDYTTTPGPDTGGLARLAQLLAPAGLHWVCSADYLETIDGLHLTAAQQQALRPITDPLQREEQRDAFKRTTHRRDYWVKEPQRLPPEERIRALRQMPLHRAHLENGMKLQVTGRLGRANLQKNVYAPILDAFFTHTTLTLSELEQIAVVVSTGERQPLALGRLLEALLVLCALGAVSPGKRNTK